MLKLRLASLWLLLAMVMVSACTPNTLNSRASTNPTPAGVVVNPTSTTPQARGKATATLPIMARIDCTRTMRGGGDPYIPIIKIADLYRCRPEAKSVVEAIRGNGPFAYDRDDIIFENREGVLPNATDGTYREYTVDTTGAATRGTRRLITSGARNRNPAKYTAIYYTDDHYETMWVIIEK